MARKKRGGGRVTPKKTRPRHWADEAPPSPPLHRPRNAAPQLVEILGGVSAILAEDFLHHDRHGFPGFRDWGSNVAEALKRGELEGDLAGLVAELFDDDEMRRLAARQPESQQIVDILASAEVRRVVELTDMGHEQSLFLCEIALGSGESVGAIVFAEYLGGVTVRDLHILPGSLATIVDDAISDGLVIRDDRSPLAIKKLVFDALRTGRMLMPQLDVEGWPNELLAVEWIFRQVPGAVDEEDEWEPALSGAQLEAFVDEFLDSAEAKRLAIDPEEIRLAVDNLLWLKLGYGNNDAELWGPLQVEYLLTDLVLRKFADTQDAEMVIAVLPELVRWTHGRLDVSAAFTEEVLRVAVEASVWAREELQAGNGSQGIDLLVEFMRQEMGVGGGPEDMSASQWWRRELVGGQNVLDSLDATPLPVDEEVDVAGVPAEHVDRVVEIGRLAANGALALFEEEPELATAVRRTAARFGRDAAHLMARGKVETAAAAVLLVALSANGRGWATTKKAIAASVGLAKPGSFTDRAHTLCNAVGLRYSSYVTALGDPTLLTSETRRRILEDDV
jgi:hypothetical protein